MITARKWVAAEFGGPEVLRNIEAGVPGASNPASGPFRARARSRILKLAQDEHLVVPYGRDVQVRRRPRRVRGPDGPHPPGKLALVNDQ